MSSAIVDFKITQIKNAFEDFTIVIMKESTSYKEVVSTI